MRYRNVVLVAACGLVSFLGTLFAQNPFKEWPAIEYDDFPKPTDWQQKAEWTRARLRYPDIVGYPNNPRLVMRDGSPFPGYWTMDYPRSDRHLLQGVRRLTRIDTRSVDDRWSRWTAATKSSIAWPVLYAVEVGHWKLPADEAAQLRDYLLRGGFLMVDDFHGSDARTNTDEPLNEWQSFTDSMSLVFPDRAIEDLPNSDAIFHVLYDLNDRFQVPGAQYFKSGITYEKGPTGREPHWRGIRDDHGGRVMVAICHNMDLGDAWEHSDEPEYLEKWASLAYRIAMNYFIYDLSH